MHVGQQKRLDVLLSVAKGMPVGKALVAAGYSENVAGHKSGRILSGRAYVSVLKKYCDIVAGEIGREHIAAELALIKSSQRWTNEVAIALRKIHEAYVEMKPDNAPIFDASNDTDAPAVPTPKKRERKFDKLMRQHQPSLGERLAASRGPKYEAQVQALIKKGESITPEHLGFLGRALLQKDLIRPPRDHRARVAIARTALESSGVIGPRSTELHLHAHHSLPPVVQQMLESKMLELMKQDNRPTLAGTIVENPSEPIHDKATATAAEWQSEEEAALELLQRNSAGQQLKTVLAGLQETARQGAQVGLRELADKEIHR